MAQATGMQQDEIQAVRQNALAIAGLTGRYNGQATLDQQQIDLTLRKYLTDVAQQAQENKRANQELELRVQQAARDGKQIDMMPDGTLVAINLDDLSVETLGNYAKVSSGGGGGGSSGGGGGTYSSGVGGADLTPYALDAYERTVGANAYRSVTDSDIPMLTDLYTQRYYNAGYLPPNQYYGPAGGNIGSFNPFTPTPSNSSAGVNLDDLLGGTGVQL